MVGKSLPALSDCSTAKPATGLLWPGEMMCTDALVSSDFNILSSADEGQRHNLEDIKSSCRTRCSFCPPMILQCSGLHSAACTGCSCARILCHHLSSCCAHPASGENLSEQRGSPAGESQGGLAAWKCFPQASGCTGLGTLLEHCDVAAVSSRDSHWGKEACCRWWQQAEEKIYE